MTFTPTDEQLAIVAFAKTRKENLLISALAGAAKTSTLELICAALPVQPILSLAFNKRIAEEMKKRLPGHVSCKTMNALGHGVWAAALGKRLILDTDKTYTLLKGAVDALKGKAKEEAYETFTETKKAISRAKLSGYIPPNHAFGDRALITRDEFLESYDEEDFSIDLVDKVLSASIAESYAGKIDFDDQIYMPTLFGGTFPRFPLVLVDEAQDLSALNHEMLRRLAVGRLIAVGDPFQSIYGFRGAVSSGMSILRDTHSMHELPLSVSFRCPKAIVARARTRAPTMQYPDWAAEGEVRSLNEWTPADIPDHSAIICRNNAPLFSLAFSLIRAGRGIKLVGSDIGPGLVRTLKKLGPETMSRAQVVAAIDAWQAEQEKKTRRKATVVDKADCLRVFAYIGDTLAGAIAYAEHLFSTTGPIQLLSGHKSKGLEWDIVFHLDPWRIPSDFAHTREALEQEANLDYVITTRAKRSLTFIDMESFRA